MLDESKVLKQAIDTLRAGGVIAYPTEYCFGLGCDPLNQSAVRKLLDIKQRNVEQGVILIAANHQQVSEFTEFDGLQNKAQILDSWPGAVTWLLPTKDNVPDFITGKHSTLAMRVPDHQFCRDLCAGFGSPIVSTSANRHGQAAILQAAAIEAEFGAELDFIVPLQVGGAKSASSIFDAVTGAKIR